MRVFAASPGPCTIDAAVIVVTDKWTGCRVEDKVAITIHVNMACYQFRRFDAEFLGYIVNLGIGNGRTNSTATVPTIEATEEFKGFLM